MKLYKTDYKFSMNVLEIFCSNNPRVRVTTPEELETYTLIMDITPVYLTPEVGLKVVQNIRGGEVPGGTNSVQI